MPLYDYACQSCGHDMSLIRSYEKRHDPENEPCPECGEQDVKYRISAPNISYSHKGSMRTSDSFNDRLKEIKKGIPERFRQGINDNIR